nr:hypothetical protein [Tanacetum cinerariifolium]
NGQVESSPAIFLAYIKHCRDCACHRGVRDYLILLFCLDQVPWR